MKIEVNILQRNVMLDSYLYSDQGFYYNDKLLEVDNKKLLLTYLISMTSGWEEVLTSRLENCFEILVDTGSYSRQYIFGVDYLPVNFSAFIYEIKKLAMEV